MASPVRERPSGFLRYAQNDTKRNSNRPSGRIFFLDSRCRGLAPGRWHGRPVLRKENTARPRQWPRATTERGLNVGCRGHPCTPRWVLHTIKRIPAMKIISFGDVQIATRNLDRMGEVMRDCDLIILSGDLT